LKDFELDFVRFLAEGNKKWYTGIPACDINPRKKYQQSLDIEHVTHKTQQSSAKQCPFADKNRHFFVPTDRFSTTRTQNNNRNFKSDNIENQQHQYQHRKKVEKKFFSFRKSSIFATSNQEKRVV